MTSKAKDIEITRKSRIFDKIAAVFGLLAALYLLNIGAGVVEFIPDNMPVVGNFDEAGATGLLILCLKFLMRDH